MLKRNDKPVRDWTNILIKHSSSTTEIMKDLLVNCQTALQMTTSDPARVRVLDELAPSVSKLEGFVRGYQWIEDPSIDTDDEILNWTFSEAAIDFSSALWLLTSSVL
jgi:hypothetical protein